MDSSTGTAPVAFVDTSAIVALVDRDDSTHQAAVDAYHSLVEDGYRLFTTNHVVNETFDLIDSSLGNDVARQWLGDVGLNVYITDADDEKHATERVLKPVNGRHIRYSDAVSLTVMERLGVTEAFAVDPEFLTALDT